VLFRSSRCLVDDLARSVGAEEGQGVHRSGDIGELRERDGGQGSGRQGSDRPPPEHGQPVGRTVMATLTRPLHSSVSLT